jgi:hypothetical protein
LLSDCESINALRTEYDANSTGEALEVTLALFDVCLPKLKYGGYHRPREPFPQRLKLKSRPRLFCLALARLFHHV